MQGNQRRRSSEDPEGHRRAGKAPNRRPTPGRRQVRARRPAGVLPGEPAAVI